MYYVSAFNNGGERKKFLVTFVVYCIALRICLKSPVQLILVQLATFAHVLHKRWFILPTLDVLTRVKIFL